MSRTKRKPLAIVQENEEAYLKRRKSYCARDYVLVLKTKEEYDADVAKANAEYKLAYDAAYASFLAEVNYGITSNWSISDQKMNLDRCYRHKYWVSKHNRVPKSQEEIVADEKHRYRRISYDGFYSETSRTSGFKRQSKRAIRKFYRHVDLLNWDKPYATDYEMKKYIWSWW